MLKPFQGNIGQSGDEVREWLQSFHNLVGDLSKRDGNEFIDRHYPSKDPSDHSSSEVEDMYQNIQEHEPELVSMLVFAFPTGEGGTYSDIADHSQISTRKVPEVINRMINYHRDDLCRELEFFLNAERSLNLPPQKYNSLPTQQKPTQRPHFSF